LGETWIVKSATGQKSSFEFACVGILSTFLICYGTDYLVFRYRVAAYGFDGATSTVTIFDAAPLKNGRVSVFYDQPQKRTCVRSIFPWWGYDPCWYLRRNTIQVAHQAARDYGAWEAATAIFPLSFDAG
jgi:hypothetical protein